MMNHQKHSATAQKLLEGIGSRRDPVEIAALFDTDLVFEIQGDDGVLPWIGRKTGRQAIAEFIRDALQTRIKATGKLIATQFAIILTITNDVVTRFQMLEDSFDVSKAARA
jgi:hypothetical protein